MIVAGILLLAISPRHPMEKKALWRAALAAGPMGILMGIAALFDPRILVCIGVNDGVVYPTYLKALAVILIAAGLLIGFGLSAGS